MISKIDYIPKIKLQDGLFLLMSGLMTTLLGLVLPFAILIIFDRVMPNNSTSTLYYIYAIILVAIFLDFKIKAIEEKLTSSIGTRFESLVTNQMFQAVIAPHLQRFKELEVGEYLERLNTIPNLKSFFGGSLISSGLNLFTCFSTLFIITLINTQTGLILISASVFLFVISYRISNKKTVLLALKSDIEGLTNSKVIEVISFPHDIKSRAMEYRIENLMRNMIKHREHYSIEFEKQQADYTLLLNLVQQLSVTLVVVSSAISVINMEMSQGIMAAIIMLTNRYFSPYQQAMGTISQWKVNKIYINKLNDILSIQKIPQPIIVSKGLQRLPILEFANQKISLAPDKINIISGKTGAGKSALFNYLQTTDHKEIQALQHEMVLVNSHSCFIEGTIIDNLTCYRPQLHQAAYLLCEALQIKDDLDLLRLGFFTEITGKTDNLFSRQVTYSLLLVRALLSNKHILLIDDFDLVYNANFVVNLLSTMYPRTTAYTFIIASNKINQLDSTIHITRLGD